MADGASELSSSSISSPPISPQNNGFFDTIHVARPPNSNPGLSGGGVVTASSATSAPSVNATSATTNGNTSTLSSTATNGTAPEKPKRQRKKKEVGPDGKPVVDDKPKEKKPRKPREPKDKTATATSAATSRKKPKIEEKTPAPDALAQSRQPTITEMVGTFQSPKQPASSAAMHSQSQSYAPESIVRSSLPPPATKPSTPRPFSSGQNYDPIRGSTMDTAPPRPSNPIDGTVHSAQTSPHVNRASASPAIASLIDPPMTALKTSVLPVSHPYSPQPISQQPFVQSQQSPIQRKPSHSSANGLPQKSPTSHAVQPLLISNMDGARDVEPVCEVPDRHVPDIVAPPKSSSSAPTPKAARPTPDPPKGTGSGLLSTSDLFGGPSSSEPSERKGVNIDIRIPLNPKGGNHVNMAQEIIKKYGREAINPRAAAHRDQLLRIAAEQNKLEGGSADDMSVDLMSELEGDSNVEMGGMDDENTGADGEAKPPRKRRKKVEEYDKDDDFIDDTELAWQEQAAVAKDGFFVYSGPLVPDGQQAQVEASASTRGSRGGRGRGRGSRTATAGTTHASLADKTTRDPASTTSTRARGTRARGTTAPRKPRITKADRERLEAEKADRERTAGAMGGPSNASLPVTSTPAPAPASGPGMQQSPPQQQSYAQPVGSMA